MKKIMLIIALMVSVNSHAWQRSSSVSIKELVQWEGSSNALMVLSDGKRCYVPLTDKELYSFVLAVYMSGKLMDTYCHDQAETIGGYSNSHKLHRLNAM